MSICLNTGISHEYPCPWHLVIPTVVEGSTPGTYFMARDDESSDHGTSGDSAVGFDRMLPDGVV
jgi:hypothetical protein